MRLISAPVLVVLLGSLCGAPSSAIAGPPFLTDDPEPVPFRHFEAYLFSTVDRGGGETFAQLPAFEFNVGAAPNLQLHVVVPFGYAAPGGGYSVGDLEVGVKYRFIQESGRRPQVGVFPMIELPTGDSSAGTGNGTLWARLPIWIQKSGVHWITYGGGGYQVNRAAGMKDSGFAGWLIQRKVSESLALGGEAFFSTAQAEGEGSGTIVDAGGTLNVEGGLSLLFMAGHSVQGENQMVGYLGLYYTWGGTVSQASAWSASPMRSAQRSTRRLD